MRRYSETLAGLLVTLLVLSGCGRDGRDIDRAMGVEEDAPVVAEAHPMFDSLMTRARVEDWHEEQVGDVVERVALFFEGAPYVAGLLDRPPVETLVTSFDGFDCVLLVETAVAAARTIRRQDYSFEGFLDEIESLRYRSGEMDGYCSRLHYFSEWILDNEKRGTVRNITAELGGVQLEKRLNFMTEHRGSYPRIVSNDSLFAGIQEMESSLSGLQLFYIPQDRIRESYDRLRSGDIIATATRVPGLDVSHTGLVYRNEDRVGFLHASTSGGVMVSSDLQDYVENIDIQIGIVVARPL